jgi:hypothetical protein
MEQHQFSKNIKNETYSDSQFDVSRILKQDTGRRSIYRIIASPFSNSDCGGRFELGSGETNPIELLSLIEQVRLQVWEANSDLFT